MLAAAPAANAYGMPASVPAPPSVCPMPAVSQVFSSLGDTANYALVPGGNFSGPLAGWALNNASVVPGGDPLNPSGSSLNIAPGGSATSPVVCVSSVFPSWRFFAQAANGGALRVTAQYTTSWGLSGSYAFSTLNGSNYSTWAATNSIALGSMLPEGTTANVRFVFSADYYGGAWNIDDVNVDPYAR